MKKKKIKKNQKKKELKSIPKKRKVLKTQKTLKTRKPLKAKKVLKKKTKTRRLKPKQEKSDSLRKKVNVKIIGVGGAGGNVVSRMKDKKFLGVEFTAINTDFQGLQYTKADIKIQIGKEACRGLGAGMDPTKGKEAAEENLEEDTVTMTTLWYGSMTMEKISFKHLPLKKGVRHSIIEF